MDFQREYIELTASGVRYYGMIFAALILLLSAWSAYRDIRRGRNRNQVYTEFGVMAVIAAAIAIAVYKLVSGGEQRVRIQYYGIIIVAAMLAATVVAAQLAKRTGRDPEHVYGALTWAIIPGIVLARLWFVVFPSIAETQTLIPDTFQYTLTVQQSESGTPTLGLQADPVAGLIVPEDSYAETVGLQPGDKITAAQLPGATEYAPMGPSTLESQLTAADATYQVGDEVKIKLERQVPRDRSWFFRHFFDTDQGAIAIWNGGLSVFGAILGGFLGAYVYLRKNHLVVPAWLDIAGVVIPLSQAIGRWANYVNQELYGKPLCNWESVTNAVGEQIGRICHSPSWWGLTIPREKLSEAYQGLEYATAKFHPLFLYESVWSLLAFLVLLVLFFKYRNRFRPGDYFLLYVAQYSVIRFFLEFLRVEVTKVGDINLSQLVTAVLFVVSAVWLAYRHRQGVTIRPYLEVAPPEPRVERAWQVEKPAEETPVDAAKPAEPTETP